MHYLPHLQIRGAAFDSDNNFLNSATQSLHLQRFTYSRHHLAA